ncbi:Com family DNA-binding transcriptional regulator [Herminiimonas arsenitoxidans]|uniref:Com family DNA-binding transcriptional regulator n=1 Tax=Herminiimonas arsenitoxidans TaxID=1809410 RepID=UPI00097097E4|nr:Com family DNA-binding transcriptional regulator [Herminiimonas arsenitoxidans]
MQEIRCGSCNKKLGVGIFTRLIIKCPRCAVINQLRAMSPAPERHRAPAPGVTHDSAKETTR